MSISIDSDFNEFSARQLEQWEKSFSLPVAGKSKQKGYGALGSVDLKQPLLGGKGKSEDVETVEDFATSTLFKKLQQHAEKEAKKYDGQGLRHIVTELNRYASSLDTYIETINEIEYQAVQQGMDAKRVEDVKKIVKSMVTDKIKEAKLIYSKGEWELDKATNAAAVEHADLKSFVRSLKDTLKHFSSRDIDDIVEFTFPVVSQGLTKQFEAQKSHMDEKDVKKIEKSLSDLETAEKAFKNIAGASSTYGADWKNELQNKFQFWYDDALMCKKQLEEAKGKKGTA